MHRADLRAEVVFPPLVAEAYLRIFSVGLSVEGVGRLVYFLVVYREECGALERIHARRPAKVRVLLYARERDPLSPDYLVHPRDMLEPLFKRGAVWHEARSDASFADGPAVRAEC